MYSSLIKRYHKEQRLFPSLSNILEPFLRSYLSAVKDSQAPRSEVERVLSLFLDEVTKQLSSPYFFPLYHLKERHPFDYYQFGLDFIAPLVDKENSSVRGKQWLDQAEEHLAKGHNVVFFANHQTELDPQCIAFLLQRTHPLLNDRLLYVAGHRVVTDPLAVPFSRGCNLLSIYAKKYLSSEPPEERKTKIEHNQKTLNQLQELLDKGAIAIYVAPSGGRDRATPDGTIPITPFQRQSIEMFLLMGQRSPSPTHFFPMALSTYSLLPPPPEVRIELGEPRHTHYTALHMAIGKKWSIDPSPLDTHLPPHALSRREEQEKRALSFHRDLSLLYESLPPPKPPHRPLHCNAP